MKSLFIGIAAVSVYAVSSIVLSAPVSATTSTSDCLDSSRRSSFVTTYERGKGTIATKDGKPLCDEVTVALASYNVPDTWDRKGWNPTAIPQTLHDSVEFTIPKGQANFSKTMSIKAPDACKNLQMDFYWAPAYADITTMTSDEERNITGELFAATKDTCEVVKEETVEPETPKPAEETPVATEKPAETVAPAVKEAEVVAELPQTGVAGIAGVFGLVSSLGAAGHYLVGRSRRQ